MIRSPSSFKLLAFLWVLTLSSSVVADSNASTLSSAESPETNCQNLLQRREWYVAISCPGTKLICPCRRRTLADTEKTSYITAVQCMQSLPTLHNNVTAVRTRFDEFQALHIEVADRVHATVSLYCSTITVRGSKSIVRVTSFLGTGVSCECMKTCCGLSATTLGQYRTPCCCP